MKPEEEYRSKIDPFFENYFHVEREIWSTQSRRIDYVLRCKQSNALFGIEVKHGKHMRGEKMGAYLLQAHDYSKMFWKTKFCIEPTKLIILITPAISNTVKQIVPESKIILKRKYIDGKQTDCESEYYQAQHQSDHEHTNVNSWLSAFGVGEIRQLHSGRIIFSYNNKILWENKNNNRLHEVNFNFYKSKL